MATSLIRYPPVDVDTVLYTLPVSTPLSVTDAPVIAAPPLSRISPAIAPRSDCARRLPDISRTQIAALSAASQVRVISAPRCSKKRRTDSRVSEKNSLTDRFFQTRLSRKQL